MDILTKVKMDHSYINSLLQQIIYGEKAGSEINNLIEDLLEELKEHIAAEKTCISEMFLEKGKQAPYLFLQTDKETIDRGFSDPFYQELDKALKSKVLKNKLHTLEKLLREHSEYIENLILRLAQECLNDQQLEELALKFEQEKIKTLISSITYA